jgi:hypothetical protein
VNESKSAILKFRSRSLKTRLLNTRLSEYRSSSLLERQMDELPALTHLPLIPEPILRQHHVNEAHDTRFRACARLLQALWREDRDLPIGYHVTPDGKRRKLGSRISNMAGRAGANFLTPAVAALAQREMIYREAGALIDEQRLRTNLLSSMPLTFNLLGPLKLDLSFAMRVLHQLRPSLDLLRVTSVRFEHSPGRGDAALTGDGTAFDALITYVTPLGRTGFVAIEVKYSEAGHEPCPTIRPRYDEIASASGLFVDPSSKTLRANPLQQLFREHCLAQAMLMRQDYDKGCFIVIAPRLHHPMQGAIRVYEAHLNEAKPHQVSFQNVTLEQVIAAIAQAGEDAYARALHRRYTDFLLVDGEIELALAELPKLMRRTDEEVKAASELKLIDGGRS